MLLLLFLDLDQEEDHVGLDHASGHAHDTDVRDQDIDVGHALGLVNVHDLVIDEEGRDLDIEVPPEDDRIAQDLKEEIDQDRDDHGQGPGIKRNGHLQGELIFKIDFVLK